MPLVIFTATPKLPRDMAHLPYVAGYSEEMTADRAERWIRRGVARVVIQAQEPAPVVSDTPVFVPASVTASAIDPETATEDEMRSWLTERGTPPHHRTGEARLRELVMEALTA